MPIYEYECQKCGHVTEAWQGFSDPPLQKCEDCRGKVRRLISQSTFHLKGSGWYVTDYASKSGGKQEEKTKSESKEKGVEAKGADDSPAKKPATKKEDSKTDKKQVAKDE